MDDSLKLSEAKYRELVEGANSIILRMDESGNIVFFNEFAQRFFGYSESEIIGQNVIGTIVPKTDASGHDLTAMVRDIREHAEKYVSNENENIRKDGRRAWIAWTNKAIYDEKGQVAGILCIGNDITERKRLDELKSQFVSMVSHELRTPLAAIKESVAIVLDGVAGQINPEQRDFLDTAKRNLDRLARLINNILDYQKLDAGSMSFEINEADINAVVEEVSRSMRPLAQNKGLALDIDLAKDLPLIKFDRDKIIQVLSNLINNAIKFTDKGGITVSVSISKEANTIQVCVKDTGIGMKREDMGKLFLAFSQLASGKDRKPGSTGLGLAISKQIILGHNGKIWAESEPGQGSKFCFVLPVI